MGSVLEMRRHRFASHPATWMLVASLLALSGCGNDVSAGKVGGVPVKALFQATLASIGLGPKPKPAAPQPAPTPAQIAASRQMLEAAGVPLYIIQDTDLHLSAFFGKLGQNGDVVTWATPDHLSVSLRDGMVVATRGLGPDIMSSSGPTTAQVARGHGQTQRSYTYLDTADQSLRYDFTCQLSLAGTETITLIGKPYKTRRIDESCHGSHGDFTNIYWFDTAAKLRQSSQLLALGIANLRLESIID